MKKEKNTIKQKKEEEKNEIRNFYNLFEFFSYFKFIFWRKKCKDLIDKPIKWSKCIKDKSLELSKKGAKKLNTDSKLTDWVKKKLGK